MDGRTDVPTDRPTDKVGCSRVHATKNEWDGMKKKLGKDRTHSLSTNSFGCLLQCLEKGCLCVTPTKALSR